MFKDSLKSASKLKIRKNFLQIRKLSVLRKANASRLACKKLPLLLQKHNFVLSFAPTSAEIDLWPLNKLLLKDQKLLLPKVWGQTLKPYAVTDLSKLIPHKKWGILEPNPKIAEPVDLAKISIALIPALAFDSNGGRLGHGKGFYDRFLKQIPHVYTIGVGFKEQFSLDPLPLDRYDVPVNSICLF